MLSNNELKKNAQFICEKTGIVYHEESFFQLAKRVYQNEPSKKKILSEIQKNIAC